MKSKKDLRERIEHLENYSDLIRKTMLDMYASFGFGCVSGAFSMVELYVGLYLDHLDTEKIAKNDVSRTRVMPKPTSILAFYPTLSAAGIMERERLNHYGTDSLRPIPHVEVVGIDSTIYTLGPVIGTAAGLALSSKIRKIDYQTICIIGDGELQEGVDQPAKIASLLNLDNIALIMDCNELQSYYRTEQADPTTIPDSDGILKKQKGFWEACGWAVEEIDGHDFRQILYAYSKIGKMGKPYIILARTKKGKGIPEIEGKLGYQHRISREILEKARKRFNERVEKLGPSYCLKDAKPSPQRFEYFNFAIPSDFSERDLNECYASENLNPILTKWIHGLMEKNPDKIVLLDTDCPKLFGKDAAADLFSKENPDSRHIFPGLNERLMLAISKSLTYEGLYPIAVSPAKHINDATEEWNAICMDKLPVLLIGSKPGATFSDWGPTHCTFDDINLFSKPNGKIFQPSNRRDLIWVLNNLYKDPAMNLPVYLRLIDFDIVSDLTADLVEGTWERGYYVASGEEHSSDYLAIMATGDFMRQSLKLENRYGKRNKIKVLNLFNLSNIDPESIQKDLKGSRRIVSLVEAKSSSISELIFTSLSPEEKMVYEPFGIDDGLYIEDPDLLNGNFYNAKEYVLRKNGLDTDSLARRFGLEAP